MTAGIIIADASKYDIIDYKYYVVQEAVLEGGMFDDVLHVKGINEEKASQKIIGEKIIKFLIEHDVSSVFAYNAGFDRSCMPFLERFVWHDIMRVAAYRQYNSMIPSLAECCKTGRLKRGYGVESMMRMLGNSGYIETHNALLDARDELEIMRLIGRPLDDYPEM
ncbi:MAG: hypothetical protein KH354_06310 [Clostridiales bacterium]|nr:hypothetical protein [Clostridiales bacterium]